jgi:hypothetical protein
MGNRKLHALPVPQIKVNLPRADKIVFAALRFAPWVYLTHRQPFRSPHLHRTHVTSLGKHTHRVLLALKATVLSIVKAATRSTVARSKRHACGNLNGTRRAQPSDHIQCGLLPYRRHASARFLRAPTSHLVKPTEYIEFSRSGFAMIRKCTDDLMMAQAYSQFHKELFVVTGG